MNGEIYEALAKRLDFYTNGFPRTESGVELRILCKLFTPEDVLIALRLRPTPEPAEKIAARTGKPAGEMQIALDDMATRGLIGSWTMDGAQKYNLSPFILGFWEFQVDRLDRELADLFDEYAPHLVGRVGGSKPALARVVPLNAAIDAELQVLNWEDMRSLIAESKSFQLMDCICRKKTALQGKTCSHSMEVCMVFFREEGALDYHHFGGRIVNREEALAVLERTEMEGLVHCTYNIRRGQVWVCNCCPCCCDLLIGLNRHKAPHLLARSNFEARIDADLCTACGKCARNRCPTEAIVKTGGFFAVQPERCIGCGVCVPFCHTGAITLQRRPEAERDNPPADLYAWHAARLTNRTVDDVRARMKE